MAVRIRLRRIGKKKQPQYRLVVAEASGPRDGRFIEAIGHYNPRVDPPSISVNEERALDWLKKGAQPSDTAKSMLIRTGVWEKFTGEPAPTVAPVPPAVPEEEAPTEAGADEAVAAPAKEEPAEVVAAEEPAASEAEEAKADDAEGGVESSSEDAPEETSEEDAEETK